MTRAAGTPGDGRQAAPSRRAVYPYVQIARVDHWFKNVFVLPGTLLAAFYAPAGIGLVELGALAAAVVATCLVASSNYVLNELLDGRTDAAHPRKRHRPVPLGLIRPAVAYAEWIALAVAGALVAAAVNRYVVLSVLVLWVMGVLYNVRPVRAKDWPYVDVLVEALNNVIRLGIGWWAINVVHVPPVSLLMAYWMVGAFFMATKRLAEYRYIDDPDRASAYRDSFRFYTESRLLVSTLFYGLVCALFTGIFIVRYQPELILFAPVGLGLLGYYLHLGLQPDSPVQHPERLFREAGFVAYAVLCVILFVALMFTSMPTMHRLFNVEPAGIEPLWTIGRAS